jgi:hypothetical protein
MTSEFITTLRARLAGARKSVTMWFNAASGAVVIGLPVAQEQFPVLSDYLPHDVFRALMTVVIFGNFVLRFKTNSDLKDK